MPDGVRRRAPAPRAAGRCARARGGRGPPTGRGGPASPRRASGCAIRCSSLSASSRACLELVLELLQVRLAVVDTLLASRELDDLRRRPRARAARRAPRPWRSRRGGPAPRARSRRGASPPARAPRSAPRAGSSRPRARHRRRCAPATPRPASASERAGRPQPDAPSTIAPTTRPAATATTVSITAPSGGAFEIRSIGCGCSHPASPSSGHPDHTTLASSRPVRPPRDRRENSGDDGRCAATDSGWSSGREGHRIGVSRNVRLCRRLSDAARLMLSRCPPSDCNQVARARPRRTPFERAARAVRAVAPLRSTTRLDPCRLGLQPLDGRPRPPPPVEAARLEVGDGSQASP